MSKHIQIDIKDGLFTFARTQAQIAEEAALDGNYIFCTNVDADKVSAADVVRSYKELAKVERAFRTMKSDDLAIRPIGRSATGSKIACGRACCYACSRTI